MPAVWACHACCTAARCLAPSLPLPVLLAADLLACRRAPPTAAESQGCGGQPVPGEAPLAAALPVHHPQQEERRCGVHVHGCTLRRCMHGHACCNCGTLWPRSAVLSVSLHAWCWLCTTWLLCFTARQHLGHVHCHRCCIGTPCNLSVAAVAADNFVEDVHGGFQCEVQKPYVLYRNRANEVRCTLHQLGGIQCRNSFSQPVEGAIVFQLSCWARAGCHTHSELARIPHPPCCLRRWWASGSMTTPTVTASQLSCSALQPRLRRLLRRPLAQW